MSTWIIGIDRENPEHWGLAKQFGFWDMTQRRRYDVGDTLHFWQAGRSLLGTVVVTKPTYEVPVGTWMPWNIDDAKRDKYRYRVEFEVVAEDASEQPTWTAVKQATGVKAATNLGPQRVHKGEAWLIEQVGGFSPLEASSAQRLAQQWVTPGAAITEASALEEDLRRRIEASIVLRQGQGAFRRELLATYSGRCCITGTSVETLLDAAHIVPYRGTHTDLLTNGLLLRTDLHTLFDRHLLTVTSDHVVHVSPTVADAEYAQYDGHPFIAPEPGSAPLAVFLQHHNERCAWLRS